MSNASQVLDSIIVNEPTQAVEALQDLIKAKAQDIVASMVGAEDNQEEPVHEETE